MKQTFNKSSQIGELAVNEANLAAYSKIAVFEPILKHNVPDKFWDFITQTGPVWQNGRLVQQGTHARLLADPGGAYARLHGSWMASLDAGSEPAGAW